MVKVSAAPQLMIVHLSKVSKTLYQEVALTYILYSENHFQFENPQEVYKYIIALTPNRQLAIRSVTVPWGYGSGDYDAEWRAMWAAVGACQGLQTLEIIYDAWSSSSGMRKMCEIKLKQKVFSEAVSGISSIKVTLINDEISNLMDENAIKEAKKIRGVIEEAIQKLTTEKRHPHDPRDKHYRKAIEMANLIIDGEGRLGEDRKPGMVSLRMIIIPFCCVVLYDTVLCYNSIHRSRRLSYSDLYLGRKPNSWTTQEPRKA